MTEPGEVIQTPRSTDDARSGPVQYGLFGSSLFVASIGTMGAIGLVFLISRQGGHWDGPIVLGIWWTVPYAAMAGLAFTFRRYRASSVIILLGAMPLAWLGVYIAYANIHYHFSAPAPGVRGMNCGGPIIELGLPVVQGLALAVLAFFAGIPAIVTERRLRNSKMHQT